MYTDSPHELLRERFTWGRNYDKDMNRLPKTEIVKLKGIPDDHLLSLVDYTQEYCYPDYIVQLFINEKEWRGL